MGVRRRKFNYRWRGFTFQHLFPNPQLFDAKKGIRMIRSPARAFLNKNLQLHKLDDWADEGSDREARSAE